MAIERMRRSDGGEWKRKASYSKPFATIGPFAQQCIFGRELRDGAFEESGEYKRNSICHIYKMNNEELELFG